MAVNFEDQTTLFNFVFKQGNGVKGLTESGVSFVPQTYVQPLSERIATPNAPKFETAQPIDLSRLDGPHHIEVVKQIVEAAESLGFFQVVNHGVSAELIELLKKSAYEFFAQPAEEKAIYLKEVSPSQLVKYGSSFLPEKEKAIEWKDYISMLYTNDHEALQQWPQPCREVALEFLKSSKEMVKRIVEVLMENLGVRLEEERMSGLMGTKMVNMNYYPTCPSPELIIGIGRLSDTGMLTVLLQDSIGGLSVKLGDGGEWAKIPHVQGALVIIIGDTMQILSNERYKSVEHRAGGTTNTASRVSVPFFTAPNPSAKIGPLPEVVKRDGVARYKEFLFGDYMNNFFDQPHEGKKSLDFARAD